MPWMSNEDVSTIWHRDNVITCSNLVTAYDFFVTGTKIIHHSKFNDLLGEIIYNYIFDSTGHAKIRIPTPSQISGVPFPKEYVSAGVGLRTLGCPAYVSRTFDGKVKLFLRRDGAIPATECWVTVDTRKAYLAAQRIINDKDEHKRITDSDVTHVLTSVSAPDSPLPPDLLIGMMAGDSGEDWDVKTITKLAKESHAYYKKYCVVSD